MGRARGLLLGGTLVVLLEALTGAIGLVVLGPVEIAFYLLACALATAVVTAFALLLIASRPRGEDGGDPDDGGDGDDGPGGSDGPPPWWPGFERAFWRHVHDRERTPT